jgi:hypothetical protein
VQATKKAPIVIIYEDDAYNADNQLMQKLCLMLLDHLFATGDYVNESSASNITLLMEDLWMVLPM